MDHHSTEMDASAAAMQGLYQHVKAVYRSVKDANARVESAVAFTPLPIHDSTPSHQPSSANTTPRGRVVAPLSAAERRPWGYHSPARQPSPQRESSPKTMPRNVAAAKSPSPNRSPTPNAEKPALPLAPRAPSPAAKRLEITPTATPIRGSSPSSVRAARGSPAAQPRRTTAAAVDVHAERFTALEAKIDELSIVLESERQQRQVLEAELAVLRAQQAQNTELRRQVEEQRESMMALSSQVQFALAWIQQVDRHIAQEDEQRGGAASAHQSQTSIGSSPSQSRHQLSSEHHHHPHHAGDVSTVSSAYRLPPSQPVALVHP